MTSAQVRLRVPFAWLGAALLTLGATTSAQEKTQPMKPMRLVFTGDSITGYSDLSKYMKFSHILDCMLEARLGPGRAVVLNRGKGGDSTAALLQRLQADVLDAKPETVVMLIGGNDAGQKVPRETTAANLDRLVTEIKAVCPRLLLLQYHVLPWPEAPDKAWAHLDDNNDLIAAAAQKHGCPLLDMAPIMSAAVDNSVPANEADFRRLCGWLGSARYRSSELVGQDGVHLMFGGELVFARAVFAKLLELNWLVPGT